MKCAKKIISVCLITLFIFLSSVVEVHCDNVQQAIDLFNNISDILVYVMPAVAFGMTLGAKDRTGTLQYAESAAASMSIMGTLKYSIVSTRPNGEPHSFPSGHTTIAITTAEFMRMRYGWQYGWPAYFLSAVVGYARVRADEHYPIDIAGGAVIGFLCAHYITKPYKGWMLKPTVVGKIPGIMVRREF